MEDLVVHYDGSVRNAEGDVVQINYGCDGLDPTYMEGKIVTFQSVVSFYIIFGTIIIIVQSYRDQFAHIFVGY